jgi:uncharacterized protein (DUF4415 family)
MSKSKPDFSNVSTSDKSRVDPDDAPELTDELLERFAETAEIRHGDRIIRRGRPPLGDSAKGVVTIRLDADVLESYRALGTGWQTQLNADLRRVRKLGTKVKKAM